jgi:hypothetical protein
MAIAKMKKMKTNIFSNFDSDSEFAGWDENPKNFREFTERTQKGKDLEDNLKQWYVM